MIEQIVELQLRGPRPSGLTCTTITGYFYDKTKISKENLRVGFYLLLKFIAMAIAITIVNRLSSQCYFTKLHITRLSIVFCFLGLFQ